MMLTLVHFGKQKHTFSGVNQQASFKTFGFGSYSCGLALNATLRSEVITPGTAWMRKGKL